MRGRHSAGSSRAGINPGTLMILLIAVPHACLSEKPKEIRVRKMKRFKPPQIQGLKTFKGSKVPNCNRETIERQGRRNAQSLRMKSRCQGQNLVVVTSRAHDEVSRVKLQVRQTDQVWFHRQLQVSSLAGDLQWRSCPLLNKLKDRITPHMNLYES